jgi:hypothetical protein
VQVGGTFTHREHLGWLVLLYAGIGLLSVAGGAALVLLGLSGGVAFLATGAARLGVGVAALSLVGGAIVFAGGVPELLTAWGLHKRTAWGRYLGIVMSAMVLPLFPLGTLLGGYGLWVLMSEDGVRAYGVKRSWLGDIFALVVGWHLSKDDPEYRRYRRRRGSSGALVFVIVAIIAVIFLADACQHVVKDLSDRAAPHVSEPAAPTSATPAAPTPRPATAAPAPTPPTSPNPAAPAAPAATTAEDAGPPAPKRPERKPMITYVDDHGTTQVVDDMEKVPARFRGEARVFAR